MEPPRPFPASPIDQGQHKSSYRRISNGNGGGKSSSASSSSVSTPCKCSVCGDVASEHLHYGAICCFSCRAFFRRYADRDGCVCTRGDDRCTVDVAKRNDCMSCRIKKCYVVGMKKEYVRGPNQALRKKRQDEGFRGKKIQADTAPASPAAAVCTNSLDGSSRRDRKRPPLPASLTTPPPSRAKTPPEMPPLVPAMTMTTTVPRPLRASPPPPHPPPAQRQLSPLAANVLSNARHPNMLGEPHLHPHHHPSTPTPAYDKGGHYPRPQDPIHRFSESQNQLPNDDGRAAAGTMWGSHNINLEANIHNFRQFYMGRIDRGMMDSATMTSEVSRGLLANPSGHTMLHTDSATGAIQPYFSQFQRTAAAAAAINGFHRPDFVEEETTATGYSEEVISGLLNDPDKNNLQHIAQLGRELECRGGGVQLKREQPEAEPYEGHLGNASISTNCNQMERRLAPRRNLSEPQQSSSHHNESPPIRSHSCNSAECQLSHKFPNIILEINDHCNECNQRTCNHSTEEVDAASPPITAIDLHSPLDFSNAPAKRLRESEELQLQENEDPEETPGQNQAKCQLRKTLAALLHGIDSVPFTREEMLRVMKATTEKRDLVFELSKTHVDQQFKDEMTNILISKGNIKPSFSFMEKINVHITKLSVNVMSQLMDMMELPPRARNVLLTENMMFSSLIGAAVFSYGNSANTFVEQSKQCGVMTTYVKWLEANGLSDSVPRMEAHYLNPSPWAEKERYEIEFNDIQREIGRLIGTDQMLSCLLVMASLLNLSPASEEVLSRAEVDSVRRARENAGVMLNRYLKLKLGPKKAETKVVRHFQLMALLKRVAKIYMEKKLLLTQEDHVTDIAIEAPNSSESFGDRVHPAAYTSAIQCQANLENMFQDHIDLFLSRP